MTFWWINIVIFGCYFILLKHLQKDHIFLVCTFIHLGVITAFRGLNVGTDTLYYANGYKTLADSGSIYHHAMSSSPVFIGYLKVVSFFFHGRNGYMISTALPILAGVFFIIKKYSRNYYMSVYLYLAFYFCFYSMNTTRHFLAIVMTLISFHLVNRKKTVGALIVYALALGVHSAAIIYGVYFVIHMLKWNEKRILLAAAGLLVGSGFMTQLLRVFIRIFPSYQWMVERSFITSYASGGRSAFVISVYCMFTVCLMWYWILWSKGRLVLSFGKRPLGAAGNMQEEEMQLNYELMLLLLMVAVIEFFHPTVIMFTRMINTLFIYIIILLPNALQRLKGCGKAVSFVVLAPLFVYMCMQIAGDYSGVLNYSFYGMEGWL